MTYGKRQTVMLVSMVVLTIPGIVAFVQAIQTHTLLADWTLPYGVFVLAAFIGVMFWAGASQDEAAQFVDEMRRIKLSHHYKRMGVPHGGLKDGYPLTEEQQHDMEIVISMERYTR